MAKKSPARTSKSLGGPASAEAKARESERNAPKKPAFRRVLLKLSGEALLGAKTFGIDRAFADYLAEEIRENRPLAPNTIFNDFLTNRIGARFEATRSGLFARDVRKEKTSQCVLFTDGAATYALFHVDDTTLMLWNPGTDWNQLTVVMQRGNVAFSGVRLAAFLRLGSITGGGGRTDTGYKRCRSESVAQW